MKGKEVMKYNADLYLDNQIYGEDPDFTLKSEKIVKCRKLHRCGVCEKDIIKGELVICETGFQFGSPVSTYTCIPCMENWMEEIGVVEKDEEMQE